MATINFDTLADALRLEDSGMNRRQAETVVTIIQNSQLGLATESDISILKSDVNALKFVLGVQVGLCFSTLGVVLWLAARVLE